MSEFIILTKTEIEDYFKVFNAGIEGFKGQVDEPLFAGKAALIEQFYEKHTYTKEEALNKINSGK